MSFGTQRDTLGVPGWEGFPRPPSWKPFCPLLDWTLSPQAVQGIDRERLQEYETDRLDEAIQRIVRTDLPLGYNALPAVRVLEIVQLAERTRRESPTRTLRARHVYAYELDRPLWRRGCEAPRRVWHVREATLYSAAYACHAYFSLRRTEANGVRLTVAGANTRDCERTWHMVAVWIRARAGSVADEPV